ncbi:MAG: hypothetical protein Sylvanvirus13_7 [Sylvanvirus sp.]|uniref:Lipoprotein n=1 Tax=Sylvanvirus sp. TaxID=2487774 RepID=A0A3G5AI98_9VIRU|nr:MAG: hypothetical protein Sylvanvirus13_7 [Sylvanvirus sp.]
MKKNVNKNKTLNTRCTYFPIFIASCNSHEYFKDDVTSSSLVSHTEKVHPMHIQLKEYV